MWRKMGVSFAGGITVVVRGTVFFATVRMVGRARFDVNRIMNSMHDSVFKMTHDTTLETAAALTN